MRSCWILLCFAFAASAAHAQTQCRSARPHVGLELVGDWPDGERAAVTVELRAALEAQDLELCLGVPEGAVARIRLRREGERVQVAIGDAVTDKRVERTLELTSFPLETRSLAIAIAADELLRASWAELLMVDAPEPAMEPPPEVRAAVARSVPSLAPSSVAPEPTNAWLELSLPIERFGGGDLWLGGGLRAERWWAERVALRVGLGGRAGTAEQDALGEVRARALVAELDVLIGGLGHPARGWHLVGGVGVWTAWVSYRGEPNEGALGARQSGAVVTPRGSLLLRYALGPVRFGLELGAGGSLLGAAATADGARVTGSHGAFVHGALTFGVKL